MKVFGAVILICAATVLLGWGITRGAAEQDEQEPVGRFQVAVPDLVLDTATGRLTNSKGQVLEQPLDPTGEEIGRYSVDGYVTAVTREAGLNVVEQPVVWPQLVKDRRYTTSSLSKLAIYRLARIRRQSRSAGPLTRARACCLSGEDGVRAMHCTCRMLRTRSSNGIQVWIDNPAAAAVSLDVELAEAGR